ncbi:MAG: alpha/beta fold hydrolase [Dehalococcoidia bacterium]
MTAVPTYFGRQDRPRFGWLHLPEGEWSGVRVVICPPLGYEGLFAHPTLRYLAMELERAGAAVIRIDYDGTGDSAGSDHDHGRVEAWLDSIVGAAREVERAAPSRGPVVFVGLRAGALLAAHAALRLWGIDGLVLWAPVTRGKHFVREQRAFAKMAVATAAEPQSGDDDDPGFEANGYYFSDATVADLGALDLRTLSTPPARRTLVLWRDDVSAGREELTAWTDRPEVEAAESAGYSKMMDPPISMEIPADAVARICEFVRKLGCSPEAPLPVGGPYVRTSSRVQSDVIEEAVWYANDGKRFGILTSPIGSRPTSGLILLNNAKGYRVGPHGMNPPLARRLAQRGVATLRLDVGGVGDSELPDGREPHHVYGLDAVADVRAAVDHLKRIAIPRIFVGGLCSGAYLAWHAAMLGLAGLVLLNLQTFYWTEALSLDVSPLEIEYESEHYRHSMRSKESWAKLLRGGVDVRYVAGVMSKFVANRAQTHLQRVRTWLPALGTGSPIGDHIRNLAASGTSVHFIFTNRDPGLTMLRAELGGSWRSLIAKGQMRVDIVPGSDHSFTPGWASKRLGDLIEGALAGNRRRAEAQSG